jgi:subtilisin-like proprotein convertase family protein
MEDSVMLRQWTFVAAVILAGASAWGVEPACIEVEANEVGLVLPTSGTVSTTINVTEPVSILDLDVRIRITHPYSDELRVALRSPSGTWVSLFDTLYDSGNMLDTVFDDDGPINILYGEAPFTGTFRPRGLLSHFIGEDAQGEWTLRIADDVTGDGGTLTAWALLVNCTPGVPQAPSPETCSPDSGFGQLPDPPTEDYYGPASDGLLQSYDNFNGVASPITGVRWWGTMGLSNPCVREPMRFEVSFYAASPTGPDNYVTNTIVTPTYVDTGQVYFDEFPLYRFEAYFDSPVALESGWISIKGDGNAVCNFFWADSSDGDAYSRRYQNLLRYEDEDLAYCLLTGAAEGEGGVEGEGDLEGEGTSEGSEDYFAECGDDALWGQPFMGPAGSFLATASAPAGLGAPETESFESFLTLEGAIREVRWWGFFNSFNMEGFYEECLPSPATFEIAFLEDNGGVPGLYAAVDSVNATVEATPFVIGYNDRFNTVYEFSAVLSEAVVLENGWLKIYAPGDGDCQFYWASTDAPGGNGQSFRLVNGSESDLVFDLAACLETCAGIGPCEGEGEGVLEGEGEGVSEGINEGEGSVEGEGEPEEGEDEDGVQTSDQNGDMVVSLSELLRLVQLYNYRGLHCAEAPENTEDGYVPGVGDNRGCGFYDADYDPPDWIISLNEMLRLIQFYNSGGYRYCPFEGTEDGFCLD